MKIHKEHCVLITGIRPYARYQARGAHLVWESLALLAKHEPRVSLHSSYLAISYRKVGSVCGCTARFSVAARGNVRSAAVWARGAVAATGAADGATVLQVEGNDTDAEKISLGALADGFAVKVKGDTFKRSGIPNSRFEILQKG